MRLFVLCVSAVLFAAVFFADGSAFSDVRNQTLSARFDLGQAGADSLSLSGFDGAFTIRAAQGEEALVETELAPVRDDSSLTLKLALSSIDRKLGGGRWAALLALPAGVSKSDFTISTTVAIPAGAGLEVVCGECAIDAAGVRLKRLYISAKNGRVKIGGAAFESLDVRLGAGTIELSATSGSAALSLESGSTVITGHDGALAVSASDGDVLVDGGTGARSVVSAGGDIDIRLASPGTREESFALAEYPVIANSFGGCISLTAPAGLFRVTVRNKAGRTIVSPANTKMYPDSVPNGIEIGDGRGTITLSTETGDVKVRFLPAAS